MNTETNDSLLPQIFDEKLELGLSGSGISLKDLEISTGKSITEIGEVITEKLCSLPVKRAKSIWNALDEGSRNELTYNDYGTFNIDLIDKLNISGNDLQFAFSANLTKHFFELDNAPLSTPQYSSAFLTIQAELLSTCKQLYSAKPNGKERLIEFLNSFEIESLASVVRHEIARYYVDELGADLDWDMAESETGSEYIENEETEKDLLEEPEEFDESEIEKNELGEFKKVFVEGYIVPPALEFTYWIQNHVPEIYLIIRNLLMFFSKEQEINIWDRPNAAEPEPGTYEDVPPVDCNEGGHLKYMYGSDSHGLVSIDAEREERRLIRVYSISHPLKNDFQRIYLQDFEKQGRFIAKILRESGKDTGKIQTFDELRKAVWDAIGFTGLRQWINRQEEPKRLLESSGKKLLFDEMNALAYGAFGSHAIFYDSLEQTKNLVFKLYGWFCLLKIFWDITKQNRRFSDLATVKDDKIIWDETITVNTLIFQAVLNTDRMFFSLDDMIKFCEVVQEPQWCDTTKESFEDLARAHDAVSAIPLFHEKIDNLKELSQNIFLVADQIVLGTKNERELVEQVKLLVKDHYDDYMGTICHRLRPEKEVKDEIGLSFVIRMKMIPGIEPYKKLAEDLLNLEINKVSFSEFLKRIDQSKKQYADDFEETHKNENTEKKDDADDLRNPKEEEIADDFEASEKFKNMMDIIKKSGDS